MIAQVSQSGAATVGQASAWFGISRQAYYEACQRQQQQALEEQVILQVVREYRQRHPRMGGRKLLYLVRAALLAGRHRLRARCVFRPVASP